MISVLSAAEGSEATLSGMKGVEGWIFSELLVLLQSLTAGLEGRGGSLGVSMAFSRSVYGILSECLWHSLL